MEFYLAYCSTCRKQFEVFSNPPWSVIHRTDSDKHLHPITREEL